MKTGISIPDPLFQQADKEARKRGITRSRLYADALKTYLQMSADDEITANLDKIYSQEESRLDPVLGAYVRKKISESKW